MIFESYISLIILKYFLNSDNSLDFPYLKQFLRNKKNVLKETDYCDRENR